MDIHKIIENCIRGDRASQKLLFETYAPKMMTVCRRYARYDLEADDFMQEGFIKIFKNLHQFKKEGSFEGWIRRIMVNTALQKMKKKSFKNEELGIDPIYHQIAVGPMALSNLNEEEILKIIALLPDGYKMVFNLSVIEGYNHKEISDLLGITESTSRSQLAKARKWLQKRILTIQRIAV